MRVHSHVRCNSARRSSQTCQTDPVIQTRKTLCNSVRRFTNWGFIPWQQRRTLRHCGRPLVLLCHLCNPLRKQPFSSHTLHPPLLTPFAQLITYKDTKTQQIIRKECEERWWSNGALTYHARVPTHNIDERQENKINKVLCISHITLCTYLAE